MQTNLNNKDKKAQLVEKRKKQILTAARLIFAQNGFRRTKIDQIADYLNVGKGTLYRYFKDKKSLFLAVFSSGMAEVMKTMRSKIDPVTLPQDKFRTAVTTFCNFFDNNRDLIEISMQVRSEFKDDYKRIFLDLYSDYSVRIQDTLRNGVEKGIFRELDVERTAEAYSALLNGLLQIFYLRDFALPNDPPTGRLTDRTDAVTSLLLNGLLKQDSD